MVSVFCTLPHLEHLYCFEPACEQVAVFTVTHLYVWEQVAARPLGMKRASTAIARDMKTARRFFMSNLLCMIGSFGFAGPDKWIEQTAVRLPGWLLHPAGTGAVNERPRDRDQHHEGKRYRGRDFLFS